MKNNYFQKILFFIMFSFTSATALIAEPSLYQLEGEKILFNSQQNIITASGNAIALNNKGQKITSNKIIYDKQNSIIQTASKSIFTDNNGNKLIADEFFYDLNKKKIIAKKKVKYSDAKNNLFNFDELQYFVDEENGTGKNFLGQLSDNSSVQGVDAEFDAKKGFLKIGKSKDISILSKFLNIFKTRDNTYTTCKIQFNQDLNIKEYCPDWSIDTSQTVHDTNEKMVYHYNSVIKIKDIPIFYTPYFSHPDPTVKRKSGFLPPSIKNFTNLGQTFKTPYFWAINDSKDFLFTPIYYFEENPIFLGEYRQQNNNSKLIIDSSYTQGYKNINKLDENGNFLQRTAGSRNHLFLNFLGNYNDLLFNKNDLEINIQRVSQKNYLKVNQITTNFINQDIASLKNNIILNSYEQNKRIYIKSNIYESLNDDNPSTKYQYTFPEINYTDYFSKFGQSIQQSNNYYNKNFGGDSNQSYQSNKIDTDSVEKIYLNGLSTIFKTSTNNINSYNQNVAGAKENFNSDIYFTGAIDSAYPLVKFTEDKNSKNTKEEYLKPRIFGKFTSGSMTDASTENRILNYSDIYSMNRMNNNNNPETGLSIGYGFDYENKSKNKMSIVEQEINFSIGQVINPKKNNKMPNNSSLNNTMSNIIGEASFKKKLNELNFTKVNNDNIDIQYKYTVSNDLNKILKNSINSTLEIDNNKLRADYYKIQEIGSEHYIDLKYENKITNEIKLNLGIKKNIKENFTENNSLGLNYESDCFQIGLNLSKTFYQNSEIKPTNTMNLILIFKPFGSPISPDLTNLLN